MALKVLLADDSAAIKKVVQLSLQDMGVELKTISSGKDALDLAKEFKPDIAFIDVLLPQKSGYDVASEMKKENGLKNVPIVLLWSAFMAFDEAKYGSSGANAKLEKPFESNALRKLVSNLVPKAKPTPDIPKVEFDMPIGSVPPKKGSKAIPPLPIPPKDWNEDGEWVKKDLGKFKVPIPEESSEEGVSFEYSDSKIVDTSFLFKPQDTGTGTMFKQQDEKTPVPTTVAPASKELSLEELSDLKLETRQIIEKVVWKLVPEIASQIIKEELNRLMAEEP